VVQVTATNNRPGSDFGFHAANSKVPPHKMKMTPPPRWPSTARSIVTRA